MEHSELFIACKQNDLCRVKELLDHGADPNLQSAVGRTALMMASHWDQIDVVRLLLLDHRTDPNLQTYEYGWTALIWASYLGHIDIVRLLLLDHRTDPNLQTYEYGWTALIWASRNSRSDVVRLLEAACWNRNVAQPLIDLGIFPEGLIREHLTV